jgi:hypothetical protein
MLPPTKGQVGIESQPFGAALPTALADPTETFAPGSPALSGKGKAVFRFTWNLSVRACSRSPMRNKAPPDPRRGTTPCPGRKDFPPVSMSAEARAIVVELAAKLDRLRNEADAAAEPFLAYLPRWRASMR